MPNSQMNIDLVKITGLILKVLKYLCMAMFVYCLSGLAVSIKKNLPLWINPAHATGTIVDYQDASWQSYVDGTYTSISTKLPVVEFQDAENNRIRFTDNTGQNSAIYGEVKVIYAKNAAGNAQIDKGLLNWLDNYIWLFGTLCGLLGMTRLSNANIEVMVKKAADL